MTLPKELTTVTPFSKYLAMILFIIFPFVGFYLGSIYEQRALTATQTVSVTHNLTSTLQTSGNAGIQSRCPVDFLYYENKVFSICNDISKFLEK